MTTLESIPLTANDEFQEERQRTVSPWDNKPFRLVSWWDMEKFGASSFYLLITYIANMRNAAQAEISSGKTSIVLGDETAADMKESAKEIKDACEALGLSISAKVANAVMWHVSQKPIAVAEYHAQMEHLETDIRYEMEEKLFFYLPASRANFYDQQELFGVAVNATFPTIQFDMVEAGNCYAAGRGTACVFHLMRIMEVGVQGFGAKLGVTLVNEKNWQNILDEINKAIKTLNPKDPGTVEMSEASANLYSVKLAWRNEVMHPNDTYTLEEAENLIRQVKIFMGQLATIV